MAFRKLSPDLFFRVRNSLERYGYCFLGADEMQRLLSCVTGSRTAQLRVVEQFAKACGAIVETIPRLTSARFVKAQDHQRRS